MAKPRLVFFRSPNAGLPEFIKLQLQQQTECLALFFDVVVILGDCDYRRGFDQHEPDVALFESGVYERGRLITNTEAHPQVLKAGLCNADSYCLTRSTFLSDMERW